MNIVDDFVLILQVLLNNLNKIESDKELFVRAEHERIRSRAKEQMDKKDPDLWMWIRKNVYGE